MTRMRRRLGPLAALVVLACALGALTALLRPARADLVVVCSNTASVCDALASAYEERRAIRVDVVRVPTTEALARLAATGGDSEFDVWLGGPAEAHAEAERLGLLEEAPGIDASGLPAAFHSRAWFGIYGGVLALCTTPSARSDAASWASLVESAAPVLVPLPLTSGTAATMLNVHAERLGGIAESIPYLRALDAKVVSYSDSGTDPAHLVAIGRAPIAVAFDTYCDVERSLGADVETVYPADGTGFEVGAASLPRTSRANPSAADFLAWVVSDEGQALGASIAGQSPISTRLTGNLSDTLASLRVPLYGTDPAAASRSRSAQIAAWEAQVYAPPRCGAPLGPSCAEVPDEERLDRVELAPTVARTGALAAGAGLLALLFGSLIALGARFGPRAGCAALPLVLLPALVPPAVTAEALVALGAPPYATGTLLLALALNATPFAALVEAHALGSVSRGELLAARDLGATPRTILSRLLGPALRAGAVPAFALAALMAASDVSASTVNGGSEPYLASLARHSLNAGLDYSLAGRILLVHLVAAALTTAVVIRWARLGRSSPWASKRSLVESARAVGRLSAPLGSGLVLLGVLGLALMGVVLRGLVAALRAGTAARLLDEATRSSAVILLLVVPLSALVGLLAALLPRHRLPVLDAAALLALLASPVAGGILVRLVLRRPLEIDGRQILPSLLGGASPGGGLVAVVVAHLLLAIPAAYFLMSFALSGTRRVRRAAEDAGAPRSREILDVLVPVRAPRVLAAIAALSALTMCMSAPAVFVVPAGSAFPAVALVPYGVHGSSGEVFTLGALGGASALAMILLGLAALVPTLTRRPRA